MHIEGAAMGSLVSPIDANLFTEDFEEKALTTFPHPTRYWGRYVDDTMTVIKAMHITSFTAYRNIKHPNIKFTSAQEEGGSITMLDNQICGKEDGSIKFRVYCGNTHTHKPLPPIHQSSTL